MPLSHRPDMDSDLGAPRNRTGRIRRALRDLELGTPKFRSLEALVLDNAASRILFEKRRRSSVLHYPGGSRSES